MSRVAPILQPCSSNCSSVTPASLTLRTNSTAVLKSIEVRGEVHEGHRGTMLDPMSPAEDALGEHGNEEPLEQKAGDCLKRRDYALRTVRRERGSEDPPVEGGTASGCGHRRQGGTR